MTAAVTDARSHTFDLRVYYEDTDAGGVVYHASYLRFAERARTEMLRAFGWDHVRLRDELGLFFVVRRCEMSFRRPGHLDDRLTVVTSLLAFGGASLELSQIVRRAGVDLVPIRIGLALLTSDGRPARLPRVLRSALDPLLNFPTDNLLNPETVNAR